MKNAENEEKAQEIANNNCTHICMEDCSAESYFSSENDCLKSALEAMQWKEKELLDRACEWLNNNTITLAIGPIVCAASSDDISKEEFIESFKKAMEGDAQ